MAHVRRAEVEERAYRLWLEAGAPEGSSVAHWLQAEMELGIIANAVEALANGHHGSG